MLAPLAKAAEVVITQIMEILALNSFTLFLFIRLKSYATQPSCKEGARFTYNTEGQLKHEFY